MGNISYHVMVDYKDVGSGTFTSENEACMWADANLGAEVAYGVFQVGPNRIGATGNNQFITPPSN